MRLLTLMFCLLLAAASGAAQSPNAPVSRQVSAQEIEVRFLAGMSSLNSGQPDAAIPQFSAILASDPTLVRVRLELARAYFEAGQWARAREEFFTVLSGDLPEPVRETVLRYIREIDARRGFDWNLQVGLTNTGDPRRFDSDQINLSFFGTELPFTFERDPETRLGLRATGSVIFRRPINLTFGQRVQTTAFAEGFFDFTEGQGRPDDDNTLGARAGLRFSGARTTSSLAAVVSTQFSGGDRYEDRIGLEGAFERRTAMGFSVFGSVYYAKLFNRADDTLDGSLARASLGARRSLGGRAAIGLAGYLEDKRVDANLEDYRILGARVFGTVDVPMGLTLRPDVFYERKSFRNPSPLFTANPDERSYGAGLRVEKNDFFVAGGFSPFLDMRYRRTKSDIAAFSYKELRGEFGFERRF